MRTIKSGMDVSIQSGHYPNLYIGPDASKPTPSVGYLAFCTDTGKTYVCFVAGIWNLISSPVIENYDNHEGNVDNIMVTAVTGSGTAAEDAINHEMDISTGAGIGTARYYSVVPIQLDIMSFEFNTIVRNLSNGAGGNRSFYIGVSDMAGIGAYFYMHSSNEGVWSVETSNGVESVSTSISEIVSGDILTIKGLKNILMYYVNGTIIATHKIVFASELCYPHVKVFGNGAVSAARSISIDHMGWKVMK
jgi:hypothetical protein